MAAAAELPSKLAPKEDRTARLSAAAQARVVTAGRDQVEVYFNEKKLIDIHDSRFTVPGKVGVLTKA